MKKTDAPTYHFAGAGIMVEINSGGRCEFGATALFKAIEFEGIKNEIEGLELQVLESTDSLNALANSQGNN